MELRRANAANAKGHQSVYDKAMTIFQEGTKRLGVVKRELEKERIQTAIDHKFEQRKVQQDLITMSKDRKRFAKEAKNAELSSLRRERTSHSWTSGEKQKLLRSYSRERSCDVFPAITCTQANIPRIMRRSISNESEYYNWVVGFPGVRDTSVMRHTLRKMSLSKVKQNGKETGDIKRNSKVENIVYSVPITLSDTMDQERKERSMTLSDTMDKKHKERSNLEKTNVATMVSRRRKTQRLPKLPESKLRSSTKGARRN